MCIRAGGTLIRKTSFTSRSIRRRQRSSFADNMREPRGRWMKALSFEHVCRSAQNGLGDDSLVQAAPLCRSLGTISSSRCQTTRDSRRPSTGAYAFANLFSLRTNSESIGTEGWLANRSGNGREGWWSQTGSNRRPPACKAGALPTELWPRRLSQSNRSRKPHVRKRVDVWF